MAGLNVKNEVRHEKVLLHRPGRELLNLAPNTLEGCCSTTSRF
ncbi:MAG: hypothetical protein ACLSVD_01945 [Eggerthellaceae bacterium]